KVTVTFVLIILALLLSGVPGTARAAEEVDVMVNNKNSFTITLTFVGLNIYQFELAPGKTTIQIERGDYTHSYYGCGQLNFQDFTAKLKNNEIVVENCNNPPGKAADPAENERMLSIRNHTATTFPITLIGLESNKDYVFTLYPGNNKLYVARGNYSYSYYACSALHYGTVNVPGRGAEMEITTCSSNQNGDSLTANLTEFKVKNNTEDTVILQLNGIIDYLFTVTGSGEYLTVEKGYYQYTQWACGTTYDGVIQVTPNNVILRTPFCKGSN
ncbi:MAG: hypothetical protein R3330_15625, partial [Saprospiraceae bacterium]|nr:hypothetical protein [Saprospiraceae bacterium]